ncbi:hypothetical protein NZK27_03845 [Synechococcus sp. FGCU-3]|nr:hypothetical protein [Synechococcus sp. FGCU3]
MTINIEWQDQHGNWHHYQTKQIQADAYRVAQRSAESTKKCHRLLAELGINERLSRKLAANRRRCGSGVMRGRRRGSED